MNKEKGRMKRIRNFFRTNSYISLKIEDEHQNIAGAVFFNTYPNIPAVPPWEWNDWLVNLYGLEQVTNCNCLWIHLLLWDPSYQLFFVRPIIQYIFKTRYFLRHILMPMPPGMHKVELLDQLGTVVVPKGNDTHYKQQKD